MAENKQPSSDNNPDESAWAECPSGEISGMVNRLARQQKLSTAGKFTAGAAVLLIGAGIWVALPGNSEAPNDSQQATAPEGEFQFGSVCCSEVAEYAAAFRKGELDEEKTAQISQHIAECPHCGPEFERATEEPQASTRQLPGQPGVAVLAHSGLLISAR
jgi:hypothetical protein